MALKQIPFQTSLPADGTTPASLNAPSVEACSAVRILSKCTAGSGDVYLARYEPSLGTGKWYPYGEYHPMKADSALLGGKFSGRYAIDKDSGPIYLILIAGAGVTLSPTGSDHQIEALQL